MERKNRDKKINLLGVYDYTVWLTYFGLFISIVGIMEGLHGRKTKAIFCLAFSGLCDAFDGRIARKKDGTGRRMRRRLASRLIPFVILCVLESFLRLYVLRWG